MRVVHVVPTFDSGGTGVSHALNQLSRAQAELGADVCVVSTGDRRSEERLGKDGAEVRVLRVRGLRPAFFRYSPDLCAAILAAAGDRAVIHSHALWMYAGVAARRVAACGRLPLVLSPHGMLDPVSLNRGRVRKAVAWRLYEGENLTQATCVLASSEREARSILRVAQGKRVEVVPFGTEDRGTATPAAAGDLAALARSAGKRRFCFVGRIDPIKGIVTLVDAWTSLCRRFPDWHLVIAGPSSRKLATSLEAMIASRGAEAATSLIGPVYGSEKEALFNAVEWVIAPSLTESFGFSIAEALERSRPVLTTTATPWLAIQTAGCGWIVDPDRGSLSEAMERILSLPSERLRILGARGPGFMALWPLWSEVAGRTLSIYEELCASKR